MSLAIALSYVIIVGVINAATTSYSLMLPTALSSPKSTPTKNHQTYHYLNSPASRLSKFTSKKTSRLYFFDNFIRPYGVPPGNRTNSSDDEINQTRVELLDALLPKNDNDGKRMSLDEKARATESFQRARLAEQLRLSRRRGVVGSSPPQRREFVSHDAFRRALLEEQLRLQTKQKQYEAAMKEADEALKFRMVQGGFNSTDENSSETEVKNANLRPATEEDKASVLHESIIHGSTHNRGRNGTEVVITRNEKSDELRGKLKILQKMSNVAISASSTIKLTPSSPNATISRVSSSSLENFLATTHLPMPPREDASPVSIALAPFAHIVTSFVLLGMASVYAVCAVIDVLCNDNDSRLISKNETKISDFQSCNTRQCLKETVHVWQSACGNIFAVCEVSGGWFQRTIKSIQASLIALFYALKVVIVRAGKHSHYATVSLDSGISALRYFFYSLRSIKVLWKRCWVGVGLILKETKERKGVSSLQNITTTLRTFCKSEQSTKYPRKSWKLKRKYHLLRVISDSQKYAAKRFEQEHSIKLQQQRHRSEQEYKEKMTTLNADRVSIERERMNISEGKKQLDMERKKLLCELAVVISWYAMVSKASATSFQEKEPRNNVKKWGWCIRWFQRDDHSLSHEQVGVDDRGSEIGPTHHNL